MSRPEFDRRELAADAVAFVLGVVYDVDSRTQLRRIDLAGGEALAEAIEELYSTAGVQIEVPAGLPARIRDEAIERANRRRVELVEQAVAQAEPHFTSAVRKGAGLAALRRRIKGRNLRRPERIADLQGQRVAVFDPATGKVDEVIESFGDE